jgi:hypothetical protein
MAAHMSKSVPKEERVFAALHSVLLARSGEWLRAISTVEPRKWGHLTLRTLDILLQQIRTA